jgi:hypothetical protein
MWFAVCAHTGSSYSSSKAEEARHLMVYRTAAGHVPASVAVPSTRFWFGSTMEQLNCSLVGPISNQHGTTTQTVTMQLHVGTVCNVTGKQSSHSPSTDSFLRLSVCSLEQLAVTTAQCLTLWDGTRAKGGDCKSCTWTRSITQECHCPQKTQQIMGF